MIGSPLVAPREAVLDSDVFRRVISAYPTGVSLITATDEDSQPLGMIVGSFTHVSSEPPLISFLAMEQSRTFARIRRQRDFCVNVLAADQVDACLAFARQGGAKFEGVDWERGSAGAPVIDGALSTLDCEVVEMRPIGDHVLVLARVIAARAVRQTRPLVFFQSGLGGFTPDVAGEGDDSRLIDFGRWLECGLPVMKRIAAAAHAECSITGALNEHLVVVGSAAAPGMTTRAATGSRVPLMPPLGEAYVAFAGPAEVDRWLSRVAEADEGARERYQERLATVRERGWAMSRAGAVSDSDLTTALREYAAGDVTPHRLRRIHEVVRSASEYYGLTDIHPDGQYEIGTIVAPVLDATGAPRLVLRLSQLPPVLSGAEILALRDLVREGAAAIADAVNH